MKKFLSTLLIFIFIGLINSESAFAQIPQRSDNYAVTDLANLFSEDTIRELIALNDVLFDSTGGEVVFLTMYEIPQGTNIEDFARDVFNTWGVGSVENNNGVLVVISDIEGEAYVVIGEGLEPFMSNRFLEESLEIYFAPHFEVADDDIAAINLFNVFSDRIISSFPTGTGLPEVVQTPVVNQQVQQTTSSQGSGINIGLIIVIIIVIFVIMGASGRRGGGMMGPGGGMMHRRRRGGMGSFAGGFLMGNMLGRRRHRPRGPRPPMGGGSMMGQGGSSTTSRPTYTRSTPPRASTSRGAGTTVNRGTRSTGRSSGGGYSRPSAGRSSGGGFSRGGSTRRGR